MAIKQYNYEELAKYYDSLELSAEDNYEQINNLLDKLFQKHGVRSVLDMTCGTGAQTIGLKKRGYEVTGSDISKTMLKYAKNKSKGLGIKYYQGDIRNKKLGKFDSVIAIFNAVGHLSKKDFDKAILNVSNNLKDKGLFIFDIFNLDFMKSGGFIEHEFIDEASEDKGEKFVRFNKNTLNYRTGVMTMNQKTFIQQGFNKPRIHREVWDMQIYTSSELREKLEANGFRILGFQDLSGRRLSKKKSLSILTIAQKN